MSSDIFLLANKISIKHIRNQQVSSSILLIGSRKNRGLGKSPAPCFRLYSHVAYEGVPKMPAGSPKFCFAGILRVLLHAAGEGKYTGARP